MDSKERLAALVKSLRGQESQRKFAKSLGVSFASIQSWEAGDAMPSRENLSLLAARAGYTLQGLVSYLDNEPLPEGPSVSEIVRQIRTLPPKQLALIGRAVTDRFESLAESR